MNSKDSTCFVLLSVFLFIVPRYVAAEQIEVLWLGHATTRITSTTGKVIVIDPFLKKNPKTPARYRDLNALGKVDLILVTHGHQDHTSDLPALARLTGAKVVANFEFVRNLVAVAFWYPFKEPADRERLATGLRKANVPD